MAMTTRIELNTTLPMPKHVLVLLASALFCLTGVEAFTALAAARSSVANLSLATRRIQPSRTFASSDTSSTTLFAWSDENSNRNAKNNVSRRSLLSSALTSAAAASLLASSLSPRSAFAAPPIAIMMEEMGYFPVQNRAGDTVYVPGRVRRESTPQAVEFAKWLSTQNINLYAAYWCPHCRNQREMFGREALQYVNYVECSPKGYGYDAKLCKAANIEGFPTWKIGSKKEIGSGEMTLENLAKATGYPGKFDGSLEEPLPMSGGSCQ